MRGAGIVAAARAHDFLPRPPGTTGRCGRAPSSFAAAALISGRHRRQYLTTHGLRARRAPSRSSSRVAAAASSASSAAASASSSSSASPGSNGDGPSTSSSATPQASKGGRGAPLLDVYTVTGLTPSEAVTGADRVVEFSARRACGPCGGRGVSRAALERAARCGACGGRGRVALRPWAAAGSDGGGGGGGALLSRGRIDASAATTATPTTTTTTTLGPCPACAGSGLAAAPPPCPACGGGGMERGGGPAPQRLRLRVPAGVADGQVLRVRGHGHDEDDALECQKDEEDDEEDDEENEATPPRRPPPRRRRRGDLYVRLDVHLPLDGSAGAFARIPGTDDVASELRVCLLDALLGAEVGVATARGERVLRVPPGTQHGARLALRGAGVPRGDRAGGGAGDHVFNVVVVVPRPGDLAVGERGGDNDGGEPAGAETARPPSPPPLLEQLRAAASDAEAGRRRRRRARQG